MSYNNANKNTYAQLGLGQGAVGGRNQNNQVPQQPQGHYQMVQNRQTKPQNEQLKLLPLKSSPLYQRRTTPQRTISPLTSPQSARKIVNVNQLGQSSFNNHLGVANYNIPVEHPPPIPPKNIVPKPHSNSPGSSTPRSYASQISNDGRLDSSFGSLSLTMAAMFCSRCGEGFEPHERIVNSHGEVWHPQCFVCCQCFRPFPEGIFYEFEGRKYCEHDFHVLFAPCCGKCQEFIIGRVIKAMNNNWHPNCFRCETCTIPLADQGFMKIAGRALCHECYAKEKAAAKGKYICYKCHGVIDEMPLKYKTEPYHAYHFNCTTCAVELTPDAREVKGELYCLRCHDKMGIPICGACRRPIEERVVTALGKQWHVEHFVCAKCEKPFLGHRHYEKKGLAYCEIHYHQLFGNLCFVCNNVIAGDVFTALNKAWCVHHFSCALCDQKMSQKTKFFEFDLKPICKRCYDKFPGELKKRLKKSYENPPSKKIVV